MVRRSGRLMSESMSTLEKAEGRAAFKRLENTGNLKGKSSGISNALVLGSTLVYVVFDKFDHAYMISLGDKLGMLLDSVQYDNNFDHVALIIDMERERAQAS